MNSAVGLGNLKELLYRDAAGREHSIKPSARWLAWSPSKRELLICLNGSGPVVALSSSVRRIHGQFHEEPAHKVLAADWPTPRKPMTLLGCLVRLTYKVPKKIISPGKNTYNWEHTFGDHGESGRGAGRSAKQYPERYMPHLYRDLSGNLFIKRRRGNKYYVSKWLMW